MTWRELLKQARDKAQEAKAIYADPEGDYEKAKDLMAEAEEVKVRAEGMKKAEGFDFTEEPKPDDGVPTKDLDNLRKAVYDALQHAGVYIADSQIDVDPFVRRTVVKGGRIVVSLLESDDQSVLIDFAGRVMHGEL